MQASWLKISMPVLTESFVILQDISPKEKNEEFNLMQNLNFGFQITALFLLVYLFSAGFIFILKYMKKVVTENIITKPKWSFKQVVLSCLNITDQVYNISPSMSVFILMLELFLWLFMLMVCNTTKTNKVVIDTSHIIQNVEDALKTPKTFCLVEDDTEFKVPARKFNSNPFLTFSKFLDCNDGF